MSIYADTQTPSQFARLVNAVAGIAIERVRQLVQLVKSRRDAVTLARLDDRMLADIGLTRGDVRDAFSEPVWRDPTAVLVSRAHERRINRRRGGLGLAPKNFEAPSIVPTPRAGRTRALRATEHLARPVPPPPASRLQSLLVPSEAWISRPPALPAGVFFQGRPPAMRAVHAANASSISARTSASFRPVRAGTWNE